jgi:hypothetical protein
MEVHLTPTEHSLKKEPKKRHGPMKERAVTTADLLPSQTTEHTTGCAKRDIGDVNNLNMSDSPMSLSHRGAVAVQC